MNRQEPIRITAADDPRIAEFVSLREKDLTGRGNRFIAEGTVVLNALLNPGAGRRFGIGKLFVLENRLTGLGATLARLPADIPVYVAEKAVMTAVTGFDMHRGVLALGIHRPAETSADFVTALPQSALVVACIGISNHDNMGAIFRNAGVFGADAVLLDSTCCDPLYRKAIRVSVGAALRVPFHRLGPADELLAALDDARFELIGLSPRGHTDIADLAPSPRVALIAGAEGPGLPQTVLAAVRPVRIAQAPGMDSLNVATATGIALWQIASAMRRI